MQQSPNNPSPHLAGKYRVVGIEPGEVLTRSGQRVDLRTVDAATAEQLVAGKFPYLEAVEPAKVEPAPEPAPMATEAPAPEPAPAPAATPAARRRKKPAA